jgi:hypothetical protein
MAATRTAVARRRLIFNLLFCLLFVLCFMFALSA